jgi:transcriptional regulator with XRE-family HTH domain
MKATNPTFSANLKKARQLAGWDQDSLAKAAGIDRSLITHYENGRKNPSEESVDNICMALNITDVIGFTSDPNYFESKITGTELERRYRLMPMSVRRIVDKIFEF